MSATNAPGVTVKEVSVFPPSVAAVSTAIPAFIGYTQSGPANTPTRITSMVDYREHFEGAYQPAFDINSSTGAVTYTGTAQESYMMYYALQMYFANGGGPCYIVSVGTYSNAVSDTDLMGGLTDLEKVDEPTLIAFPDAQALTDTQYYNSLMNAALAHCAKMADRFLIMDVKGDESTLRAGGLNLAQANYAAAYYPNITTTLSYEYNEANVTVDGGGSLASLASSSNSSYNNVRALLAERRVSMGASGAIAGVYAQTDRTRGVWKAPANVNLVSVVGPTEQITDERNGTMNIDPVAGLSVNAIRQFTGKGTLVWGARTLAGNDNEWRYVSVRRFFLMVEESVQKASGRYVFEPNSAKTWVQVKSMISNFLVNQWKAGALMGNKAEDAFYVKVGLGQTMTQQDVLEGKMIVEIGLAAVRPAEFIVLRFSHKMLDA